MEIDMDKNQSLIFQPREIWLRNRVMGCLEALRHFQYDENWERFREYSKRFAEELLYAVTEWEKYYQKKDKSNEQMD